VKRWIVVLLIVLAVVVLISPGVVGRLAEKNIEENVAWVDSESPTVSIKAEDFDRGWFTSAGRHRVELQGGSLRTAGELYTADSGNRDLPSLVIDTRIDHGLLPVTSLSRDAGSLLPGLASTVSTFQIDPGNGELVPLPGVLYSDVGLTGSSDSRFLLESGSFQNEIFSASWDGADVTVQTNPGSGAVGASGSSEPFSISQNGETVRFGAIAFDVDQVRGDFDFNIGKVEMEIGGLEVISQSSPFSIARFSLTAENEIRDDRVNAESTFALDALTVPNFGNLDVATEMSVEGLDAASLRIVTSAFQEAQAATDPNMALQMLYPEIEADVERLVSAGGTLRFEQFDVTLPQGMLETEVDIKFAELDADATFSWPAVLLGMTAKIDMKMPVELYELVKMMNPEAGSLVAMGLLVREGDHYVMDAEYAQGLLNVNGAPMPIPMPAM